MYIVISTYLMRGEPSELRGEPQPVAAQHGVRLIMLACTALPDVHDRERPAVVVERHGERVVLR